MIVFSELFKSSSELKYRSFYSDLEGVLGSAHRMFLPKQEFSVEIQKDIFDQTLYLLLTVWTYSCLVREATLILGEDDLFNAVCKMNTDKNIVGITCDTSDERISIVECNDRGPESYQGSYISIQALASKWKEEVLVSDYNLRTAAEDLYRREFTSVWVDGDALRKNGAIVKMASAYFKCDQNYFIYLRRPLTEQDATEIVDLIENLTLRDIEMEQVAKIGSSMMLWLRAKWKPNLKSKSFSDYLTQSGQTLQSMTCIENREDVARRRYAPDGISIPRGIRALSFVPTNDTLSASYLSVINDVRVFGKSCNIGTEDGNLLCATNPNDWTDTTLFVNSEPEARLDGDVVGLSEPGRSHSLAYATCVRRVREPAILIGCRWGGNIGHFLVDSLPRLVAMQKIENEHPIHVVVGGPLSSWKAELLALAGFTKDRVIAIGDHAVSFDKLYVPGRAGRVEHGFGGRLHRFFEQQIQAPEKVPSLTKYERIFISRATRPNDRRTILNGEEMDRTLSRLGFVQLDMNDLSIAEKAMYFSHAKIIAGVIGAGLYNLLISQSRAHVVVVMPEVMGANKDILAIAGANQSVFYFYAEAVACISGRVRSDIYIDCNRFAGFVESLPT